MGLYNLNAGFGQTVAEKIMGSVPASVGGYSSVYPTGGKTFLVCPTAHPNFQLLQQLFTPDPDGLNRIFTTIASALLSCVANRGDIIYVAEGYTETIATAWSGVPIAGVRIVGMGDGTNRPTFTFSTAITANIPVAVTSFVFQNCIFTCNFDAITAMVTVTGADCGFYDCDFNTNNGTMGTVVGLLGTTAARLKVVGCRFVGPATNSGTTTTAQIDLEAGIDYVIENNYFMGKVTQNITNGATILGGKIHNNVFVTATGTKSINMSAASTPMITNNRMNVPSGTAPVIAAAGFVAGNAYSAAAGVTAGTALTW